MTKYVLNSGRWSSVKDRTLLLARVVKGLNQNKQWFVVFFICI